LDHSHEHVLSNYEEAQLVVGLATEQVELPSVSGDLSVAVRLEGLFSLLFQLGEVFFVSKLLALSGEGPQAFLDDKLVSWLELGRDTRFFVPFL